MSTVSVEELLRDLVGFQTVTGDFAANDSALTYIEAFLRPRGLFIERRDFDGYGALIATSKKTRHPKVMLVAHVDVVPAPKHLFTLRERESRFYGRGVWDMKHAAAAFLSAVDLLGDRVGDHDFGIMIFTDDEGPDCQTKLLLDEGWGCDVAILPDGSNDWQIESLAKGVCHVRVRVRGTSGHGSRPWEGDSASLRMVDFLHDLKADFANHGPDTNTLNIGFMESGSSAWNQIPDTAEASLDIRILNLATYSEVQKRLQILAKKHRATIEEQLWVPPLIHDLTHALVTPFAQAVHEITGVASKSFTSFGASDARNFVEHGIPCIVTSPSGGGRHSEEEWIDAQGMRQFPEVIATYLRAVAVTPGTD